ncbi:MAG: RNA 2'-phosphotransferase [Candidatus Thermoplasmatota archaeon]|nr:RNA 2'-phosphotransferase [Candidatus Thermoplasmatota archaeon]
MLRICEEHGYFRGEECPVCGEEGKFMMSTYELEGLGRVMAGVLRHFPERFGLDMDEEGFVDIYKLVNAIKRKRGDRVRWLRPSHIIGLAETDPKGRYQVENNHVRATYGHSKPLKMSLPTDNIPEMLYYPIKEGELEAVKEEGILPHNRTMVHLSKTYWDAYEAGSHQDDGSPLILRIDAESAQDNGIIIQRAGKTVFTVEEIPQDFIAVSDESDIDMEDPRAQPAPEDGEEDQDADVENIVDQVYANEGSENDEDKE